MLWSIALSQSVRLTAKQVRHVQTKAVRLEVANIYNRTNYEPFNKVWTLAYSYICYMQLKMFKMIFMFYTRKLFGA